MQSNFFSTTLDQISNNWMRVRRANINVRAVTANAPAPRLMCVLAHPDDEALCLGGTIAHYAAQGVEIALVVATRGERGWRGPAEDDPGPTRMGQVREAELRRAAHILGVSEARFLGYVDGELADAPFDALVAKITRELRGFRPDVVITFDAHGMYGHPDHIAVSQATGAALLASLDAAYPLAGNLNPHRVQKLYHRVFTKRALEMYQNVFGELKMQVGPDSRMAAPWQEWAITTQVETLKFSDVVWNAIAAHRSQLSPDESLRERFYTAFSEELGGESFYRVSSRVNTPVGRETDLFEGLRVGEFRAATFQRRGVPR